jgi:hypothetical protein
MAKLNKLRNSARGQECNIRIPSVCNFNPETTIRAHGGSGAGWGGKSRDIEGSFCCSACHDAIDGRTRTPFTAIELKLWAKEGAERTREHWEQIGLIKVPA